jgi:hypothetical protein
MQLVSPRVSVSISVQSRTSRQSWSRPPFSLFSSRPSFLFLCWLPLRPCRVCMAQLTDIKISYSCFELRYRIPTNGRRTGILTYSRRRSFAAHFKLPVQIDMGNFGVADSFPQTAHYYPRAMGTYGWLILRRCWRHGSRWLSLCCSLRHRRRLVTDGRFDGKG